jgi:hypothetical protein
MLFIGFAMLLEQLHSLKF